MTPAFEPRRYDTWFLAAAMPDGQAATETSGESDGGGWVRPAETLERSRAGEVRLMPPQVWALEALAGFDTVAAFLADRLKELGIPVVISTDAHNPRSLGFMRYGIEQARRAWLRPGDVLNTRSLDAFLSAIGHPEAG